MNETIDKQLFDDLMELYISTDTMFQHLFKKVLDKNIDIQLTGPPPKGAIQTKDQVIEKLYRLNILRKKVEDKKENIKRCGCGKIDCEFYKNRMTSISPTVEPLMGEIEEKKSRLYFGNIEPPSFPFSLFSPPPPLPENQIIKEGAISPTKSLTKKKWYKLWL